VTRFEQPGPEVTNATPALPVIRPTPLAINAAFCSCRQTIVLIFESRSTSKTLSIFAPGTPKMYSTPCGSRLFTNNSAPVCGVGFELGVLISFLLLLLLVPWSGLAVSWPSKSHWFQVARGGSRLLAEFASADSFRGTAEDARRGCGLPR